MKGSVKVMLSYDYNHFEVALSSDEDMTLTQIDEMRKSCQRLADKAVRQYQIAKKEVTGGERGSEERRKLEKKVQAIKENFPKSEWSEEQKATVKALDDFRYYDYQDDWENNPY